MRLLRLSLLLLVAIGLCACSNSQSAFPSEPVTVSIKSDSHEGMLRIKAKGASVTLGTDDIDARSIEQMMMSVYFDYDFSLARHETTCGEFNKLMSEATGLVLNCLNDSLPATDVTYYDAILYANERSKAEKRDTAYTYAVATFDSEGHCTGMEGFAFRPEVDAYRLPTEAEWVAAATVDWDTSKAWTAENSGYELHNVCGLAEKGELCDMIGNAMEWVNDWLVLFSDTTLHNYVGAPDGGALGQRVVKGGSFRDGVSSITDYGRGDIYMVTSSTRAIYVGFRLAFGAIPNAAWLGSNGRANTSRVIPIASSAVMHSFAGSYKVKLVFRAENSGNLAYIDYANGVQAVVEIADTIDAYHPEISPDGKRVAFCTGVEGTSGKSVIYVRDLNATGTNLVKLNVKNAAIPRWRVLENGDTVIVYVSSADNNKDETAFTSESTWQVKFSKGKFGKPQKLFDGAYHGGISEDDRLAVTGARLLRARVAAKGSTVTKKAIDTVWYAGEQVCNASLARDSSKRTLFLDFAGKTGRKFVGSDYGAHEQLFVVDSTGKLIQAVPAPSGYSFDHTEWFPGSKDMAVATLVNSNGLHKKIVLVNLADSNIVDLAEGDELWHPNLWMKPRFLANEGVSLDLDSACIYMTASSDVVTRIMKVKMDLFWKHRDSAEIVIIGSSRSFTGMDPEEITSGFAINMSYSAEDMTGSLFFLKNYVFPLMPKLKLVALTLDLDRMYIDSTSFKNWFSDIPGYEYDKNHSYWVDGVPEKMADISLESVSLDFTEYEMYRYHNGLYPTFTVGWGDTVPEIAWDVHWFEKDKSAYEYNMKLLKEILALAKEKDVKVLGIIYPQSPYYKDTPAWGRYGLTKRDAQEIMHDLQGLRSTYPNFRVLDAYRSGNNEFTYDDFSNVDHLGLWGAIKMAWKLDYMMDILHW